MLSNLKALSARYIQPNTKRDLTLMSIFLFCLPLTGQTGWERTWIDSFDGTRVNLDNWTAQIQANYNNEVQCYTDDDSSDSRNYEVSDGTLKIIARKGNVSCVGLGGQSRSWTSGRINSKDKQEFLYGRIESRIRFHNLEAGTWPAFWMLENRIQEHPIAGDDDNINWPNPGAGEIDVWEWFSNSPNSYITNFFNADGCGGLAHHAYPDGASDVLQWHTYAIEWSEDAISFYRDSTLLTTYSMSSCPQYKEPMFILLNVAIGGNLGGNIDPELSLATMEVEYVAHCTATDSNNAMFCNDETPAFGDDDNDGVSNSSDECPNTEPGAIVDSLGCASTNVAPEVSLVVMQNGEETSDITVTGGEVTVTAVITDQNSEDTHSTSWSTTINSSLVAGNILTIDPISLLNGSYTISADVDDNGNPVMSGSATVIINLSGQTSSSGGSSTSSSSGGSSGGGSLSLYLLALLLVLVVAKTQQLTEIRARKM